ncbi:DUF4343 domain-containing protein [Actinomadura craniellae]|uniref:DUF4343 domain-containing protein n=1 Tax=Actinomadura craniellae TaxID=2231787 RepID=A0A365GYF6_9ACTN|nr:ATP-grasp domain-containing protein [Actinomadura craniellae]RAY11798.1 DUF4343 domain-containing protein [Actinomadura craniellae]
MNTLVFGHRPARSSRALPRAAAELGLRVIELDGEPLPDALRGSGAHLYCGLRRADRLAAGLGIALLEAPPRWLADLPREFTGREIVTMPIEQAYLLRRPVFVKVPNSKDVRAMTYADGSRLPGPDAIDPGTVVLVTEQVRFLAEFRLYVADGTVRTGSQYAADGEPALAPLDGHPRRAAVLGFAVDLLASAAQTLPSATVVDVGLMRDATGTERWSVVEANGAWGSGCYAADPARALDVILRSARPLSDLDAHDRRFVRTGPTDAAPTHPAR